QFVAAQYVADQVVGVPHLPAVRRVEVFGADFSVAVHPCGYGAVPGISLGVGFDTLHLNTPYHRRSESVSKTGRNCVAMASWARNLRDRTVPMGQPMVWAMSS